MTEPSTSPLFEPAQLDSLSRATIVGYEALHEWGAIALASELGTSPRILDLGCGTGTGILALSRVLPEATIVGCDPAADMLAVAKERCGSLGDRVQWVHGSLDALQGVPCFDAIVCAHVFQVIPPASKVDFLSGIRQLLRKDGLLFLTAPGRPTRPGEQALMARMRGAYAARHGLSAAVLAARHEQIKQSLFPLNEPELRGQLHESGYHDPTLLAQVLTVHAWLARA